MLKFRSMPILRAALQMSAIAVLASFAAVSANAQAAAAPAASAATADYVPTLTFDVASVRESGTIQGNGVRVGVVSPPHSCKFTATNFPAKALLQAAYGFGTPISGGPDWINDHYFTIEAKCDHSVDDQMAKLTDDQSRMEKQHMLQTLLAERFHLKGHNELKESSVYAITIAKGGPKLHEVKADPDDTNRPTPANSGVDVQAHGGAQGLEFVVHTASMKAVAGMLTSQIETPVIDHTGLPGYYDFTLQFGRPWSSNNPESWPDIFAAVQEQLGLKLESMKAPVEVLVIDHMEMPTQN
ncbi:MAG TPA: TIGR03435 family protein [Acidobacteriaceae bacterium]|jgi:uncharacterized protein (TIGR03435 family)